MIKSVFENMLVLFGSKFIFWMEFLFSLRLNCTALCQLHMIIFSCLSYILANEVIDSQENVVKLEVKKRSLQFLIN